MQKQLEGTQKYINEQWYDVHIRWYTIIIVSNTHTLPAEYTILKRNEQSIYECLLGFPVLTTFSAPPQMAASTASFAPIPETKK